MTEELPPPSGPDPESSHEAIHASESNSRFRRAAQGLGRVLRRHKAPEELLNEPTGEQQTEDTEAEVPTQEMVQSELASRVANMLTDEAILEEKSTLEALLASAEDGESDSPRTKAYYRAEMRMHATRLGSYPRLCLEAGDERFQPINDLMQNSPKLQRGTWFSTGRAKDNRSILVESQGTPITIPLSNIVTASGLDSWQGRGIQGRGEKVSAYDNISRSSAETIAMYADIKTPLPPVESAKAYIQPNGLVFYGVSAGNHRTAAALRRGDQDTAVTSLTIQLTGENYFDLPEARESNEGVE